MFQNDEKRVLRKYKQNLIAKEKKNIRSENARLVLKAEGMFSEVLQ
jgi:hypothetical protein